MRTDTSRRTAQRRIVGLTEERWAQIEGFPDYAVSDQGRVMSLRFDRILKPRVNSYGNARVALTRDKVVYDLYVSRLVAEAFLPEFRSEYRIRHRTEDKANNQPTNIKFPAGKRLGQLAKKVVGPVYRKVKIIETGETFRTVHDLARRLGCDPSSIYRVLRGDRRSHMGYTFEYFLEENGA